MTHPSRKTFRMNLRRDLARRVSIIQRCLKIVWDRIIKSYCFGRPSRYLQLPDPGSTATTTATTTTPARMVMCSPTVVEGCDSDLETSSSEAHNLENGLELDAVDLKISLLGDSQIGKTSFLAKYVGDKKDQSPGDQVEGLNSMDKTFIVRGARISYSIWEVGGDEKFQDQVEVACKDSVAIFFMFDLTSRCTLNRFSSLSPESVYEKSRKMIPATCSESILFVFKWYKQARKYNQSAIPILIGTKFDDFIQLPIDLQWTIASQARAYAKALNATLFFSSATYSINVNKVFKFITAKLFDLPWTVERNLTIGEPIIDF